MRRTLSFLLASIATSLFSAACEMHGGGSCDDLPPGKSITVTVDDACRIASESRGFGTSGPTCSAACGSPYDVCELPSDYVTAFEAANPDAGQPADGGDAAIAVDAGAPPPRCPNVTGPVKVTCGVFCEGRLTAGITRPRGSRAANPVGDYFARCAYLEAASVAAFARLERELAAHGAPRSLVAAASRARADEVRHAELTGALARRFGVRPRTPREPSAGTLRPLVTIAIENAIEGCVREAFGATLAHHRALAAGDVHARRTARALAKDEGRHAELSVRVLRWAWPRLSLGERARVRRAMARAWRGLAREIATPTHETIRRTAGMPDAPRASTMLARVRAAVEDRLAFAA